MTTCFDVPFRRYKVSSIMSLNGFILHLFLAPQSTGKSILNFHIVPLFDVSDTPSDRRLYYVERRVRPKTGNDSMTMIAVNFRLTRKKLGLQSKTVKDFWTNMKSTVVEYIHSYGMWNKMYYKSYSEDIFRKILMT